MHKGANAKVSVLINSFNGERYLKQAIESVYKQSFLDWEIVFIDNCSNDSTSDIAKNYDHKLKYFKLDKNISLGQARQFGIEKCKGRFIAFLDDDDFWETTKLEKQLKLFDKNSSLGLVYTDAIYFESSIKKFRLYEKRRNYVGKVFANFLVDYPLCLSSVMISKSSLKDPLICFNPILRVAEEFDVFLRISLKWEVACINEPLTYYRVHDQSLSSKNPELFFHEMKIIFDSLKKNLFGNDLISLNNGYQKLNESIAIYLWKNGDSLKARKKLWGNNFRLSSFILILFTFFPYFLIRKLYDYYLYIKIRLVI